MLNTKNNGARLAKITNKKDAPPLVIDEDHDDSDKENVPPPNVCSYIEQDVEQDILDSVKNTADFETTKVNDKQMKNGNNSDSDGWPENEMGEGVDYD